MAWPSKINSLIFLFILCAAAAASTANARSAGGRVRRLPRVTATAYGNSLNGAKKDYNNWQTTHTVPRNDINKVQSCSAKYNDTINNLTDKLVEFSNNSTTASTSPTGAPKNLTSYAEERVKAAESERIRCVTASLESNDSQLALTTQFFSLSSLCALSLLLCLVVS